MRKIRLTPRGFTLSELMVGLAIVGVLGTVVVSTLRGLNTRDNIDRGSQQIYDDLIYIRSLAVSTNRTHRVNFTSTTGWQLESQDPTSMTWSQIGEARRMPSDTYLTTAALTNAGTNLQANARGLYDFLNGASGEPYVTVTALAATKNKSINVFMGGALDFQ